jgi:cytochrome c oxidase assembly protein subunit 15
LGYASYFLVRTSSSSIGIIEKSSNQKIRSITQLWLKALFTLIVLIILVGGLTRLTDSGLSITEWKPITGALPPFSAESWYQSLIIPEKIPEYKLQAKKYIPERVKILAEKF